MKLEANQIKFEIENSISPKSQQVDNRKNNGIGIENLKRRLNLLYPNKYNLQVEQEKTLFIAKLGITID